MALQERQIKNRESFERKTFRALVFEPDEHSLRRIVKYIRSVQTDGKVRFSRVDGVSTVKAAEKIINGAHIKEPVHILIVKFEHPTMED